MPLVICTIFFVIFFICEGCYYDSKRIREEQALCRYYTAEHPRRRTSDFYLDLLG